MQEEGRRRGQTDEIGVTMAWPSREDAHTTDKGSLQKKLLRGLTVSPIVTLPDTSDGELAA